MKLLFLLIFPLGAWASIFDTDDRVDYFEIKDPVIKDLTRSTPSLVRKNLMVKLSSGDYKMVGTPLSKSFKFCDDANFADQPHNANCSAALVGKKKILTAAHCVNMGSNDYNMGMDDYYVVFDYKRVSESTVEYIIPKENVFTIKKELHYDFDTSMYKTALDLAVFKLDRKVERPILKVNTEYDYIQGNEIFVLGYPLGIPLKLTPNGFIDNKKASKNSFKHDLDTLWYSSVLDISKKSFVIFVLVSTAVF